MGLRWPFKYLNGCLPYPSFQNPWAVEEYPLRFLSVPSASKKHDKNQVGSLFMKNRTHPFILTYLICEVAVNTSDIRND